VSRWRQAPEEHRQHIISQRYHTPWTELIRRWPLRFGHLQFRQTALQGMKAMARGEPIVAGAPLQWIIGKRLKLALQGQDGRPLFIGGEGL